MDFVLWIGQTSISSVGDVLTVALLCVATWVAFVNGRKYRQAWKTAQALPLAFLTLYYALDVLNLERALMRAGAPRLALDLFVAFYIFHLVRFGERK